MKSANNEPKSVSLFHIKLSTNLREVSCFSFCGIFLFRNYGLEFEILYLEQSLTNLHQNSNETNSMEMANDTLFQTDKNCQCYPLKK